MCTVIRRKSKTNYNAVLLLIWNIKLTLHSKFGDWDFNKIWKKNETKRESGGSSNFIG